MKDPAIYMCLWVVFRPFREFQTHMETRVWNSLPLTGMCFSVPYLLHPLLRLCLRTRDIYTVLGRLETAQINVSLTPFAKGIRILNFLPVKGGFLTTAPTARFIYICEIFMII